jgi:hypothetical protein
MRRSNFINCLIKPNLNPNFDPNPNLTSFSLSITNIKDVASGLLASSILIGYNVETKRIIPESIEFVRSVLSTYCPQNKKDQSLKSEHLNPQRTFDLESLPLKRLGIELV